MIAVISGDIIGSRKLEDQQRWIKPLQELLRELGPRPRLWDFYRGDSFQLELSNPAEALHKALRIKACVRSISPSPESRTPLLDVRMSIGIGEKTYSARRITESNGPAFVRSGEQYDLLRKEKRTLALRSPWPEVDEVLNLCLRLACMSLDQWSINSAELAGAVLKNPQQTQEQLGEFLNIEQNSVSDRYKRANLSEILDLEKFFRKSIAQRLK